MAWVLLVVAILAEVTATVCMKLSDGFSKLVPTLGVVLGYVVAFYLMVQVLSGVQIAGLIAVAGGIVALEAGGAH